MCRKLPPFETSFSLDFIFVSLFPILYLFLLLLCLTRGFSSSAVDCIFFFKVFYKLHFLSVFFCLHCFLHLSSQIQRRKSYFYYLRFISFSLFPPIFTFMLFAVEAQTIQSKVKRHVQVRSLFLFFFSLSLLSSSLILSLNLFVAVDYSLSPSLSLFSLFTFLFCLQTAYLVHIYMCILSSL